MPFTTLICFGIWGGCIFRSVDAVRVSDMLGDEVPSYMQLATGESTETSEGPLSNDKLKKIVEDLSMGDTDSLTDYSETAVRQIKAYFAEEFVKKMKPSLAFQDALSSKTLPQQFPLWAQMALRRGVFNSALVVGTKFLRKAWRDSVFKLRLPKEVTNNNTVEFDVKLLFTKLDAEGKAMVGVYESDPRYEGKLLYIAATPAGSWADRIEIVGNLANFKGTRWGNHNLKISTMVEEKIDSMWDGKDGLGNALFGPKGLVERFPHHRFLFFGQSQGASLAQALALRYECERQVRGGPSPAYVLSFGGFRWTDAGGKELAQALIQDRQVNFVMAELVNGREVYDDVPGMPKSRTGFENMPNLFSLHRDHGVIRYCNGTCPADINYLTVLQRLQPLHFAGPVLKGLKLAIKFYGPSDVATCQDLCNVGTMQSGCEPVLARSGKYCELAQ